MRRSGTTADRLSSIADLERNPMACEEIVDEFNDLRSDIVLLFDLKNALNSAEYEFQTSLHRLKNETGSGSTAMPSTQPMSASSTSSNDTSKAVDESHAMVVGVTCVCVDSF